MMINSQYNGDWKKELPEPVFDQKPEFTELYWSTWELAYEHIKDIPGLPQSLINVFILHFYHKSVF